MKRKSTLYTLLLMGTLLALFINGKIETIKSSPKVTIETESDSISTSESSSVTVTDIDGNIYHTVTIGKQVWMVENLKTTKFRNGDLIANVTVNASWAALTTSAYCWQNNDAAKKVTYGALYNWFAVVDSRNIAPTGWHVPTDSECLTLIKYLGGKDVAGGKLKETGTSHWQSPNTGATNSSGFTYLPGGCRSYLDGHFVNVGRHGYLWTRTAGDAASGSGDDKNESGWTRTVGNASGALYHGLFYNGTYVNRNSDYKQYGFSVRCVRE